MLEVHNYTINLLNCLIMTLECIYVCVNRLIKGEYTHYIINETFHLFHIA